MRAKKMPKMLQSALWSYNLDKLDFESSKDKNLVVQSVLNYGTKDQVNWVLNNFSEREIKEILNKPRRGSWWTESLNYWTKIFKVRPDESTYEKAIQNINPQT